MEYRNNIKKYYRLSLMYIKLSMSSSMAYRTNFLLLMFASVTFTISYALYFKYLTQTTGTIAGFDFADLLILNALGQMWFAINSAVAFPMMEATINNIIKGDFDFYLTRPVNSLFSSLMQNLKIPNLLLLVPYIAYLIYALNLKEGKVEPISLILCLVALMLGTIIYFFFQTSFMTIAFYFKDIKDSIWRIVQILELDNYPYKIYPMGIKVIGFSIIPLFFISNIPAYILLGKAPYAIIFVSLVAAIIWAFIAVKFWNKGCRAYDSASS